MKVEMKLMLRLTVTVALIILGSTVGASAQTTQPQNQVETPPTQAQIAPAQQLPDFRLLNLTPDQIQKIREINMGLKDERQAANLKLRQAQRGLAEAVESSTPDESVIAQRSSEVAEAQANTIRLRSLTEARVLQVLTPDQRVKLREMRQRNLANRRANQQQSPNGLGQRPGLQRGANAPLLTPAQRRALRRQQRP